MLATVSRDGAKQVKRVVGTQNTYRLRRGRWESANREQATGGTPITFEFNAFELDIEEKEQEMHESSFGEIESKAMFEGYTKEQFMFALESVSARIAEKAYRAKASGSMGTEESEAFLDDILSAES